MPVINLPQDTRWGEVGKGLGGLIGQVAQGAMERTATDGVAKIMEDPSIAEDKRQTEAYKQFGQLGSKIYKEFVTEQVLRATVLEKKAGAAKDLAAVGVADNKDATVRALMGLPPSSGVSATTSPGASASGVPGGLGFPTLDNPNAPMPTLDPNMRSPVTVAANPFDTPVQFPTPTPAPTANSTAIVGALGGAPAIAAAPTSSASSMNTSPIARMIDQRAQAGGVTFSPEETRSLMLQVGAHLSTTNGLSEVMAPVDKAIEVKQKGALHGGEVEKQRLALDAQRGVQSTVAPKAATDLQAAQQATAANAPTGTKPSDVGDAYTSFTQEQNNAVAQAAQTGGAKAAGELISKFVTENTAAGRRLPPTEITQETANTAATLDSLDKTMTQIETQPQMQGGIISGFLAPKLAQYGYSFGLVDKATMAQLATSEQLALQTLQGHHGLGGAYLVPFVGATMPTAGKEKIFGAIETNVKAIDAVAKLESQKRALETAGYNTTQLEPEIAKAKALEQRTGTLWWTKDDRVFYQGREIDPATWQVKPGGAVELKPTERFRIKGEDSTDGASINTVARQRGMTPEQVLAKLRENAGAQ